MITQLYYGLLLVLQIGTKKFYNENIISSDSYLLLQLDFSDAQKYIGNTGLKHGHGIFINLYYTNDYQIIFESVYATTAQPYSPNNGVYLVS